MIDFWYRTSRVDISFWFLTIQMLSLHQRTPYVMQHAYFPLPKYEERKKKNKSMFSHLSLKLRQGHITQAPLIRCICSRHQIENNLQKKELPRIHPARMATGGAVTHSVWEQRGAVILAPRVHHLWCLEHKQQYPCPAWWQRCFLRPLMWYDLSSVRGSVVFKPTFPTLESWGLTHILLMN